MEIILILLVVAFIATMMNSREESASTRKADLLRNFGYCPPHEWYYDEVKDHEGVVHAWKMVCKRCGPLKPLIGRTNDEP